MIKKGVIKERQEDTIEETNESPETNVDTPSSQDQPAPVVNVDVNNVGTKNTQEENDGRLIFF